MLSSRLLLTVAWCLLILSFIIDPAVLTQPFSPSLFWSLVSCAPLFILVMGHEAWRRACPLSFISQIPRYLGLQIGSAQASDIDHDAQALVFIEKNSWLYRYHLWVQFTILGSGITLRAIFLQSDALALGIFLILLICFSLYIGVNYGGKTWCQFLCPISPVQRFYSAPGGLLESSAINTQSQLSQSMCRQSTDKNQDQEDQSTCVGCTSHCPDVDLEQNYWQSLSKSGQSMIYYGYPGLVIGFYLFQRGLVDSWQAVFSGSWAIAAKFDHSGDAYTIMYNLTLPKAWAAILIISSCALASLVIGITIERTLLFIERQRKSHAAFNAERIRHICFAGSTFMLINAVYFFGQSLFTPLPNLIQTLIPWGIFLLSLMWLIKSLSKSFTGVTS